MDRLDEAKQAELRKMSDVRLIGKLTQAGFIPEELEGADREALLNRYAEVVLGVSTVKPGAATSAGVNVPYDVELEKQKMASQSLQWEESKARWEAERLEREAERAAGLEREKMWAGNNLEREKLSIEAERAERERESRKRERERISEEKR